MMLARAVLWWCGVRRATYESLTATAAAFVESVKAGTVDADGPETARWVLNLDPEWEHWSLTQLKTWSKARTAWIHAVVSVQEK